MAETYREASVEKKGFLAIFKNWRWKEFCLLIPASLIVAFGFFLVYQAKTTRPLVNRDASPTENLAAILADDPEKVVFSEYANLVEQNKLFNLNAVREPKDILPALSFIKNEAERQFIAQKIFEVVKTQGILPSVKAISASKSAITTRGEIDKNSNFENLTEALTKIRENENSSDENQSQTNEPKPADTDVEFNCIRPFTNTLRPLVVVRNPADFTQTFWIWTSIFFVCFYLIHFLWSIFGLKNEPILLPIVQVLCGLGFILMITIHDPLRDSLYFVEFCIGIVSGTGFLIILSFSEKILNLFQFRTRHLMQLFEGWRMLIPLVGAIGLSILLLTVGKGPGNTKVNLGPIQPSEIIKILVVFFLAAYFAAQSTYLENLRAKFITAINIPRLIDFMPVVLVVLMIFVFFYLQKDLGPALIIVCTFLVLYGVARRKVGLMLLGFSVFCLLLTFSYIYAEPTTVYERVRIWLNVWENGLSRGDQIARGWWALASGGFYGTGLGLGDPSENTIPAGHTDLVLASIGEELGFVGIACILILYLVLILKFLQITFRARRDSSFFLGLGLTLIFATQIILIATGVFGLFPLTGVVNPFLSFGKTSMIANFVIVGLMCAISDDSSIEFRRSNFKNPIKIITCVLVFLVCVIIAQAFRIQSWNGDQNVARGILTKQSDDKYRYIYNPRLLEVAKLLLKGTIFDRNGIPLVTNDCQLLQKHREDYEKLGVSLSEKCNTNVRQYPFYHEAGLSLFHLLGDARSRINWTGRNRFIEREKEQTLQGFNDSPQKLSPEDRLRTVYELDNDKNLVPIEVKIQPRDLSEVVPLLRFRHFTWQTDLQKLWNKQRDIKTTIDIRLQLEVAKLVEEKVREKKLQKAAAVVVDPSNGEVLAMVSYPWFSEAQLNEYITNPPNLKEDSTEKKQIDIKFDDRARLEDFSPGSTFKIVTAIAALRKDPKLAEKTFKCAPLGDGRNGIKLDGFPRPIRDDSEDKRPHGDVNLKKGIEDSCNAYFAQLGINEIKESALWETSKLMEMQFTQNPIVELPINKTQTKKVNYQTDLKWFLPQATYGQYPVRATPLQMANVAATIANGGRLMPEHWLLNFEDLDEPLKILEPNSANFIADGMRSVVTDGTAQKALKSISVPIAGKTGTAEVPKKKSHSWFIGYAPYQGKRPLAFAVLFENGGYGGDVAAPVAGEIVKKAFELKLLE